MAYYEDIIKSRKKFRYFYKKGNYMNCLFLGQKLISIYKGNEDTENIDYADDLYNLGYIFQITGGYQQAKTAYIESAKVVKKLLGKGESYADRLNNLAVCYTKLLDYDNALKYFNESSRIAEAIGGQYSEPHLDCLYNIANLYYDMKRYDDCIRQHTIVMVNRKHQGDHNTDSLNCIGYAYEKQEDYENAVKYLKKGIQNIKSLHSAQSQEYLANVYYIAQVYMKKQDYPQAVKSFQEVGRKIKSIYSDKHPYYADTLNKLAEALSKNNEPERSLKIRLKSLKLIKEQIGENHVYYANSLRNIAILYKTEGEEEKAVAMFLESLRIKSEIIGAGSIDYIRDVMLLCGIFIDRLEYDKALELLNDTIELLKRDGGECSDILPEMNKIFNSLKDIRKIRNSFKSEDIYQKADLSDLFKMVESKIGEETADENDVEK